MRRWILLSSALLVCAGIACHSDVRHQPWRDLAGLRQAVKQKPEDAELLRAWALSELLAPGGEASLSKQALAKARATQPEDLMLTWYGALESHMHGNQDKALQQWLHLLELASAERSVEAAWLSEATFYVLDDLRPSTPDFDAKVKAGIESWFRAWQGRPVPASFAAGRMLLNLALRQGDHKARKHWLKTLHCHQSWRSIGPFGPHAYLKVDTSLPVDKDKELKQASYALGPTRGKSKVQDTLGYACTLPVTDGLNPNEGLWISQTDVDSASAHKEVLYLNSDDLAEVLLNDRPLIRRDDRDRLVPQHLFRAFKVPAGKHRLRLRLASRRAEPQVQFMRLKGHPGALKPAYGYPSARTPWLAYLSTLIAMGRGDRIQAEEAIASLGQSSRSSAPALILHALLSAADPFVSNARRYDNASRALSHAAQRDPKAWIVPMQQAMIDTKQGRLERAIKRLRRAQQRWPNTLAVRLSLIELLLARNWHAQAGRQLDALMQKPQPYACNQWKIAHRLAGMQRQVKQIERYAKALQGCDARDTSLLELYIHQRRWPEAERESKRLTQVKALNLSRDMRLARRQRNEQAYEALLTKLNRREPTTHKWNHALIDWQLAQNRTQEAMLRLDNALKHSARTMISLNAVRAWIDQEHSLLHHRIDGPQVVRAYEAAKNNYGTPQVMVLDSTVVEVFPDGSALELTHNIFQVNTEEAVDKHGEYNVPNGADMLTLRTLKQDGSTLEPDVHPGKDSISLPNLQPGDYVEIEFLRAYPSNAALATTFVGQRFYFRNFEVPLDRTELTLLVPHGMKLIAEPRGDAPTMQRERTASHDVYRWAAGQQMPLVQEPLSINAREWVPSVNTAVGATWIHYRDQVRSFLRNRDPIVPAAQKLVNGILRSLPPDASDEQRVRRLYHWVCDHIDEGSNAWSMAPSMLTARRGNRARVLHYLLKVAGLASTLALPRSALGDTLPVRIVEGELFADPVVLWHRADNKAAIPLYPSQKWAPFAYIPPQLRGQEILLLDDSTEKAQRLPQGAVFAKSDAHQVKAEIKLDSKGNAALKVQERLHGINAFQWRESLSKLPTHERRERIEEMYIARMYPGASLQALRLRNLKSRTKPFVLEYQIEMPSVGRKRASGWAYRDVLPLRLKERFAQMPQRKSTQLLFPPLHSDVQITWQIPQGAKVAELPQSLKKHAFKELQASLEWKQINASTVLLRKKAELGLRRIKPQDYPKFAEFCRWFDVAETQSLILR